MDLRESRLAADRNRLGEFFFGFPRETDNGIGGEGRAIEMSSHRVDRVEKLFGGVASPHSSKYRVRTTLQCRVELGAEMFAVGRGTDEVAIDLAGLDTRKPHSPATGDPIESLEEMVKSKGGTIGTSPGGVDTVVTDVDPGEYDFSESRVQQPLHFFLDVFRRTTLQTGSDLGNDAIGAVLVTAILNLKGAACSSALDHAIDL